MQNPALLSSSGFWSGFQLRHGVWGASCFLTFCIHFASLPSLPLFLLRNTNTQQRTRISTWPICSLSIFGCAVCLNASGTARILWQSEALREFTQASSLLRGISCGHEENTSLKYNLYFWPYIIKSAAVSKYALFHFYMHWDCIDSDVASDLTKDFGNL